MTTMKMKKSIMQYLLLLMGVVVLFSSCHKDDDVVTPEPTPEPAKPTTYTIMLYGSTGSDQGIYLDYNLDQLEAHGKTDRINFAGLVKFSQQYQGEAAAEGTRLFTLTSDGLKNEKVGDANYRLDNPAHLTQFIMDTKEKMPADKYILIFCNSGQKFGFYDVLPENKDYTEADNATRSILFDDNVGYRNSMTVYEVEKGIKDAGLKMDLIYMDLAGYGMAETYYQLRDCTKYMMASPSMTPYMGGNYSELLEDLQTNDSLEGAIKEYVPNCVKTWRNLCGDSTQDDLECYDLSYMDEFVGYLKGAMGEYEKLMKKAEDIQKRNYEKQYDGMVYEPTYGMISGLADQLLIYDGDLGYSVDVCSAFTRIASLSLNGTMSHYATMMKKILDKMTVAQASSNLPAWMDVASMGMMWPTNGFLYEKDDDYFCIADNLKYAPFYKVTGWNDILANSVFHRTQTTTSPLGLDIYLDERISLDYKYSWQYEITADLSQFDEREQSRMQSFFTRYDRELNGMVEKNPFALCLGKYAIDEAMDYLCQMTNLIRYMDMYGVEKFKIKVYTTDSVDPYDGFKDDYPTEVEKEFKTEDYL